MTTRPLDIEDLYSIATPSATSISPDGSVVAYALSRADRAGDANRSTLWTVPTDGAGGAEPRRLTDGEGDGSPRFSPDGRRIAFLRANGGPAQLHEVAAAGGAVTPLTDAGALPLGAGLPVYSPDGASIAFSAPVGRSGAASSAPAPWVADRLGYKADGAGRLGEVRRQLFVLELTGGRLRQLTDGDWNVGLPAWSPDGERIAFSADSEPDSDLTLAHRVHYAVVGDPVGTPHPVGDATFATGPLLFTPDGSAVIAVGAEKPGIGHAGLLLLPLAGGGDRLLTEGLDRNVLPGSAAYPGGQPALTPDGESVLFCLRERGWTHLHSVPLAGGSSTPLVSGDHQVVSALSVAAGAPIAAFALGDQGSFGEIAVLDLKTGQTRTLTALTKTALPDVELLATEQRTFAISDGSSVHGWLLRKAGDAGTEPGPLLLDVHGGPHNAWNGTADAMHLYHQVLAQRGWTILMLNPRGSDGYGEEFFRGVLGGWGSADAPDFLEPIDQLVAEGIADKDRLAVTGYSYGGFTTCSLTSRDNRFAAAVAGGLICDYAAMPGSSDLGLHITASELNADFVEDRAKISAISPLAAAGNVTTPTLILHGGSDERCPVNQAEQWFTALRTRNVPSRLVVYPGGSHLFILNGRPSHRLDYNTRVVDWLERYTRGTGASPSARALAARGGARPAGLSAEHWDYRLKSLVAKYEVVGAQLGIMELGRDGEPLTRTYASAGVLNSRTGQAVTADSIFQIGSISKVWTTVLVMQLVDEGLLDLDAPVRAVLPDFRLSEDFEDDAAKITMRHLLSHTSGIDGDLFTDTGRGDDVVEKYVASLSRAGLVHPLGGGFSYCNAGFVLAGRVVEVLRGATWDAVLRERVIEPLGLGHTVTLPEEAMLHATAVGHARDADGGQSPVPVWGITRSMGPAGLVNANTADLLTFAATFLRKGLAPNGTRLLSEAAVETMRTEQVDLREQLAVTSGWGIGWFLEEWTDAEGAVVASVGHDGTTLGQHAYLRTFPELGLAITMLTSGGKPDGLYREIFAEVAREVAGLTIPANVAPSDSSVEDDLERYAGVYSTGGTDVFIELADAASTGGPLSAVVHPKASLGTERPKMPSLALRSAGHGLFAARGPESAEWMQVRFLESGGQQYVSFGYRTLPKAQ